MRFFPALLRSSLALLCLLLGTLAVTAAPSQAHRYPDAVVAMVWTPTGERWIRLEQTALGYYHGSVEFASDGWMAVTEYYDFTCLLTLDDPTAPLKFHHEFRSADGYDASPSEIWTTLTFNWATGAFEQTQDFAALFEDPAGVVQSQSNQGATAGPSSPKTKPFGTSQAVAPASTGASGTAAPSQAMSAPGPTAAAYDADGFDPSGFDRSGYSRDGYDANGYDRRGVDRQGFNRDGSYQGDFDAEGYDSTGYDRDGFDRQGYDHNGRDREGYDYGGFNGAGFNRYGGYLYGYDQSYVALPNADGATAFDERGFDSSGHHRNGSLYDDSGYDAQGFDGSARNRGGFDPYGFNQLGFDQYGYNYDGFDASGFNRDGRDSAGFDRNGRNLRGFNRDGLNLDGTLYDARGFDQHGYDRRGRYDYGVPYVDEPTQPTEPADIPGSGGPSGGPQATVDGLKGLLRAEGLVADLIEDDAFVVAQMQRQAAGLPDLTPDEYAALDQQYFEDSLFNLWMDLELRIQAWEAGLGLDDDPIEVLRAKQAQIEEYLRGQATPRAPSIDVPKVTSPVKISPEPSAGAAAAILAVPEPVTGWLDSAGQWMADHPRIMGAVRGVGGMAEVIAGAAATATTSGAGAPLAIPLILHGIDQVVAGAAQVVTGEQTHSRLEKVVAATAEVAGLSPQNAEIVGSVVDAVTGIALTAGVGAGPALTQAVTTEAKVVNAVAKEVEVGTVAVKAAGEVKVILAAEDCNAAGLKRLFESLPKKADGSNPIAYLKTEAEISEVWTQLEKTGVAVVESKPGVLRMDLADGTHVVKYGSSTDKTLTLSFNREDFKDALKIHVQTK